MKKDTTYVLELGNGQLLTTIPREFAKWKHAAKGAKLRWSDAGQNRILLEVTLA